MNEDIRIIQQVLNKWYTANKRDLPWRNTRNPYKIWVSEVILQQTRVNQGFNYYLQFLNNFPTIKDLANASEEEVLKTWQGLGYYSRARNMHSSAKTMVSDFGAKFPTNYKDIRSLRGVGDYTAAAIASFAYDMPYAAVDGNVYRVLSRLYGIETPTNTSAGKKEFDKIADKLLDKKNPATHNQAIMEFGSLQCKPGVPDCESCPLSQYCVAYKMEVVAGLPTKKKAVKVRNRYLNYIEVRCNGQMLLQKRTNVGDIWQGLYQLALIETKKNLDLGELIEHKLFKEFSNNAQELDIHHVFNQKHVLSHQVLHASFYQLNVDDLEAFEDYEIVSENDLENYPVSRLMEIYFENRV